MHAILPNQMKYYLVYLAFGLNVIYLLNARLCCIRYLNALYMIMLSCTSKGSD